MQWKATFVFLALALCFSWWCVCVCACMRCECIYMSTHGNLGAGRDILIKGQQCISHTPLSLDQQLYNHSSILDTPSSKRTSSFIFQVSPTMDFTYLTRSIHTSFTGSVGMLCCRPLLIFRGSSRWFREVTERAAGVILSYIYYVNTGS